MTQFGMYFVPFTAQTRMSGVDLANREIRKGASDTIAVYVAAKGGSVHASVQAVVNDVARKGATPLVVAEGGRVLGVAELKDIVKGGIRERLGIGRATEPRRDLFTNGLRAIR